MEAIKAIVGVSAIGALLGCGGGTQGPVAASDFQQLAADQVIVGFEQYLTEGGRRQAIMRGDTAYIFEDSSLAKVRKVNLTLYNEKGEVSARLTSQLGNVNTHTQGMIARGNVVLIAEGGRKIETQELHYDPTTHRVWSNRPTVQTYQGGVLRGTGFEADDKFYNVRITNAQSTGGGMRIQF